MIFFALRCSIATMQSSLHSYLSCYSFIHRLNNLNIYAISISTMYCVVKVFTWKLKLSNAATVDARSLKSVEIFLHRLCIEFSDKHFTYSQEVSILWFFQCIFILWTVPLVVFITRFMMSSVENFQIFTIFTFVTNNEEENAFFRLISSLKST